LQGYLLVMVPGQILLTFKSVCPIETYCVAIDFLLIKG
jgi:hypothetical protein